MKYALKHCTSCGRATTHENDCCSECGKNFYAVDKRPTTDELVEELRSLIDEAEVTQEFDEGILRDAQETLRRWEAVE